MKLFQHPDFRDVLVAAAEEHAIPEQFVEKDYYVTEALRVVEEAFSEQVVFKGGTSLSERLGADQTLLRGHRSLPQSAGVRAGAQQARHRP